MYKQIIGLKDLSNTKHAVNVRYADERYSRKTVILSMNMNKNKMINFQTPMADYDAAIKEYAEDSFMNLSNDDRLEAADKTKTNPKKAQYDDEAVNLTQLTDIENRKIDSSLAQSFKSRLIIPEHNHSTYSDENVVKKYVDGRQHENLTLTQ